MLIAVYVEEQDVDVDMVEKSGGIVGVCDDSRNLRLEDERHVFDS